MSKKIDVINGDYIIKSNDARRTLTNAQLLTVSFGSVSTIPQGHYEDGEWINDAPKYQYGECEKRDSFSEANNDRNRDIDSKIAILNSRITNCKERIDQLVLVKSDCRQSIENLEQDLNTLKNAQRSFNDISSISGTLNSYSSAIVGVYDTYRCRPTNLNDCVKQGITNTNKAFSNQSINNGISKLNSYIEKANIILSGIASLNSKLEEKITSLESQKRQFQGMKN